MRPHICEYIDLAISKSTESTFIKARKESFENYNIKARDDEMLLAHALYVFENIPHLVKVIKEHLDESIDSSPAARRDRLRKLHK